jgi:hypothetical protein
MPPVLRRQADELVRTPVSGEVRVERDLQVRALPGRDLIRDDRQLRRVRPQVVPDLRPQRRLLGRRVRDRPRLQVAERPRQLLR